VIFIVIQVLDGHHQQNTIFAKDPDIRRFDAKCILCSCCDWWITLSCRARTGSVAAPPSRCVPEPVTTQGRWLAPAVTYHHNSVEDSYGSLSSALSTLLPFLGSLTNNQFYMRSMQKTEDKLPLMGQQLALYHPVPATQDPLNATPPMGPCLAPPAPALIRPAISYGVIASRVLEIQEGASSR
jgi:hypothetical protein